MGDTLTHVQWPRPGFTPDEIIALANSETAFTMKLRKKFKTIRGVKCRISPSGAPHPLPPPYRVLKIPVNGYIFARLEALRDCGLHGRTIEEAAERLICKGL